MAHSWTHLEGDGVVVLAGANLLSHAAVGAVSTNDEVHLDLGALAHLCKFICFAVGGLLLLLSLRDMHKLCTCKLLVGNASKHCSTLPPSV